MQGDQIRTEDVEKSKKNRQKCSFRYSVDCRSSNTGLFCGILVVIAALVSLILFFVFVARDELFLQVKLAIQNHENPLAYNITP